jgi:hypothetical protein
MTPKNDPSSVSVNLPQDMKKQQLIYKSTDPILGLDEALAAGRLVRFKPELDPDQHDDREIFMRPELHDWLYQKDSRRSSDFKSSVRAQLKKFIINDTEQPIDNSDYMKAWSNNVCSDVFEIRYQLIPMHRDATRIFGGFAKPDCLVLFHQKLRSEIPPNGWDKIIQKTLDFWNEALPGVRMVRARPFSNCVTGSFSDVP